MHSPRTTEVPGAGTQGGQGMAELAGVTGGAGAEGADAERHQSRKCTIVCASVRDLQIFACRADRKDVAGI